MLGRSVVVTGGTGGLGVAVVGEVLTRGGRVTASYRDEKQLEQTQAALNRELRHQVTFVRADLTVEADVQALFERAGSAEVLLHLVGGYGTAPVDEESLEQWSAMLAINATSAFLVCKHAVALMRKGGYGRIVTVGSRSAVAPGAGEAAYAASKAALVALTQAVARDLRGIDATANCVLPSIIDTPANREAMPKADYSRWVQPQSLARAICGLGSEAAHDIRGAAIPMYGGV